MECPSQSDAPLLRVSIEFSTKSRIKVLFLLPFFISEAMAATDSETRVMYSGCSCGMAIIAAVAIAQLVIGQRFGHEATCQSTNLPDLTFFIWLTVSGVVLLASIAATIGGTFSTTLSRWWSALENLVMLFRVIWIILGIIMLVDCPLVGPHQVHVMMWFSLFFNFFSLCWTAQLGVYARRSYRSFHSAAVPNADPNV